MGIVGGDGPRPWDGPGVAPGDPGRTVIRLKSLEDFVRTLAGQRLASETSVDDWEQADLEGAYESIVVDARRLLGTDAADGSPGRPTDGGVFTHDEFLAACGLTGGAPPPPRWRAEDVAAGCSEALAVLRAEQRAVQHRRAVDLDLVRDLDVLMAALEVRQTVAGDCGRRDWLPDVRAAFARFHAMCRVRPSATISEPVGAVLSAAGRLQTLFDRPEPGVVSWRLAVRIADEALGAAVDAVPRIRV